jgi:formylglycine-generating enzyme required for sulfatase activity
MPAQRTLRGIPLLTASLLLAALSACHAQAPTPASPSAAAEAKTALRDAKPGSRFRECADCPEMVVVPAGSFALPSPAGRTEGAAPQLVTIPHAFAMARTEVTIAEFRAFVKATNRPLKTRCYFLFLPQYHDFDRDDVTWEHPGFGAYQASARDPITCIDWDQAEAYAEWLSGRTGARYRLPREAFWQ